jgi:AAA+ superfamily predicted ATPase
MAAKLLQARMAVPSARIIAQLSITLRVRGLVHKKKQEALNLSLVCAAALQGPRMVRDVFRLAKENAPSIIFIDEVDAIATARFDAQTGADREVQRILMELLNQMDGFDQTVNVKVRRFGQCCC